MTPVTLKQLRYFDALAKHLHFGRAALACCVTQPALSMQLQELEQTLGLPLVERARSGLKLTPAGTAIAARAARILTDVDDLVAHCVQSMGLMAGPLRLGVIPSVAPYLLPPLLAVLKHAYPTLELHVRETQTKPLTEELLDGKLDVLLLALPVAGAELATLPLFDDRFLLAIPAAYRLSGRVRATPELIKHERLLLLEEGHCLRDQALAYCALSEISTVNTFGVSSLSTVAGMVAAGHGITLLPEICLAVETRGREIEVVPFAAPQPCRKLGLAWRSSSPRAADFHELGRLLMESRTPVASPKTTTRKGSKK
jgi:LysR family transcriptional regulator, hydrogen peroxide-inducible genes activator